LKSKKGVQIVIVVVSDYILSKHRLRYWAITTLLFERVLPATPRVLHFHIF